MLIPHLKKLILVSFLAGLACLTPEAGWAGRSKADSLRAELSKTDDLVKKINLCIKISKVLEDIKPDSSTLYLNQALRLAQCIKKDKPLADVYAQAGIYSVKKNQLDKAFSNFSLAEKYYSDAGEPDQVIRMKSYLGNICMVRDSISSAMRYYMDVIEYMENKEPTALLPNTLNNVGGIYIDAEEYNTALSYYSRSLELLRKLGDSTAMINPLLNLGEIYILIGNTDIARDYIRQAIDLAVRTKNRVKEAHGYMSMGKILITEKKYQESLDFLNRSLEIHNKELQGYWGPQNIEYTALLVLLGKTWTEAGNYRKAYQFSQEGYHLAREMKQIKQIQLAVKELSLIHKHNARFDSALFYYQIYMDISDRLAKSRNLKAVKLIEFRQDFEKKQKENEMNLAIAKSQKRTMLMIYFSSGTFLLAVILILFLMLKLEKQKKLQAEIEKNNLNEKLDLQNKELTTNVMYLTKLTELVLVIAEKLRKLDLVSGSENIRIVESIISELTQSSKGDSWKEFEVRFQNVHVDFYKKLGEQFPDLTPNELKLCSFLRLNISTKEISSITQQSQNSILVARSRLRQKLGVIKDENLVIFLSRI